MPPSWLHPDPLSLILEVESQHQDYRNAFSPPPPLPGQPSIRDYGAEPTARPQYTPDGQRYYPSPPFLPQNTAQVTISSRDPPALPYHWVEVGNMLLDAASDDLVDPDQIRRLLKDLREVRMAKMRSGVDVLDAAATGGGGVALTGVGAMEVGEERGFLAGVVDGLRYAAIKKVFECGAFADYATGESARRKNKLGENRWQNGERMVDTTGLKMMTRKTTWNSRRTGLLLSRELWCICDAYLNDIDVYRLVYPIFMTSR